MTNTYSQNFWNSMRGKTINPTASNDQAGSHGTYQTPDEFKGKFDKALANDNVFRRLATVVHTTAPEGTIQAVASTGMAEWVAEGVSIPESADAITPFSVYSYTSKRHKDMIL